MYDWAVIFSNPRSCQDWRNILKGLCTKGSYGILLMVGETTPFDYEDIRPLFREMGIPVFGGVFPGIIYDDSWYTEGILSCSIECPISVKVVKNLSFFEGFPQDKVVTGSDGTFLVIVDGLARNISSFLDALFETCSGRASFIGGGAGSLGPYRKPVLFTGEECFAGGAL